MAKRVAEAPGHGGFSGLVDPARQGNESGPLRYTLFETRPGPVMGLSWGLRSPGVHVDASRAYAP